MADKQMITIRLETDIIARADKLYPMLGYASRSELIRNLLADAIDAHAIHIDAEPPKVTLQTLLTSIPVMEIE